MQQQANSLYTTELRKMTASSQPGREIDLSKRCDCAIHAGIKRVMADIQAGFRLIDIQRTREKTHIWVEEMAWLLDGLQNSALDGLEFMLSTKILDVARFKELRAEIATIRKEAKADLVEVHSPAVGAAIFFELHHDRLKNFGQRIIRNLEFVVKSSDPSVNLASNASSELRAYLN